MHAAGRRATSREILEYLAISGYLPSLGEPPRLPTNTQRLTHLCKLCIKLRKKHFHDFLLCLLRSAVQNTPEKPIFTEHFLSTLRHVLREIQACQREGRTRLQKCFLISLILKEVIELVELILFYSWSTLKKSIFDRL